VSAEKFPGGEPEKRPKNSKKKTKKSTIKPLQGRGNGKKTKK